MSIKLGQTCNRPLGLVSSSDDIRFWGFADYRDMSMEEPMFLKQNRELL
jgi:hypothetical protein